MTRYERVLAVAEEIDKAVPAKSKARADVTRFIESLRKSKELPEHCEWAERAKDEWHVTGKAAKLFEQLEDLVNFHPTVKRMGVYDERDEKEDYEEQEFVTKFDARKICWIQWQVDLEHEEEMYGDVAIDFVWKLSKDGAFVEQDGWDSYVESSWSDSSHSCSRGDDEPGEWTPGNYVCALSLWDEPLGEVAFTVDGELPEEEKKETTVAQITQEKRGRVERILALCDALPKQHADEVRSACEKGLPKHVEWAGDWDLSGKAAKAAEAIEDLVNFHPKLARLGFYDGGEDPEPTHGRKFEKRFDADKVRFITWQIEMEHPDEQYADVAFELRWRFTNPNGKTDDEQVVATSIDSSWEDSFHFVTCGPLQWPPGKYTLRVSLWDEPFAEATMFVDESGGSL